MPKATANNVISYATIDLGAFIEDGGIKTVAPELHIALGGQSNLLTSVPAVCMSLH